MHAKECTVLSADHVHSIQSQIKGMPLQNHPDICQWFRLAAVKWCGKVLLAHIGAKTVREKKRPIVMRTDFNIQGVRGLQMSPSYMRRD